MAKQPITPRGQAEERKRTPTASSGRTTAARSAQTRAKPSGKLTGSKTAAPPHSKLPRLVRGLLEDPNAIRNLRQYLPSWIDELVALVLIALGAVALASLLNEGGDGQLSTSIAKFLRQGFGEGAFVIALGILVGGLVILLPKIGVYVSFGWGKLVALEVSFVTFQGLLHILAFEKESRALAREGGGGGYVGWAVSNIINAVLSEPMNIIFCGVVLFFSLQWLLGIKRQHYRQALANFSTQVQDLAARLEAQPTPAIEAAPAPLRTQVEIQDEPAAPSAPPETPIGLSPSPNPSHAAAAPAPITPIPSATPSVLYPRRPNPQPRPMVNGRPAPTAAEILPVRWAEAPPIPPSSAPASMTADLPRTNGKTHEEKPTDIPAEERPPLILNGQEIDAASFIKERPSIVPRTESPQRPQPPVMSPPSQTKRQHRGGRDDDPNKRYFTVEDFEERKKIGKRDENLPPLELLRPYDMHKPDEEEINRNASIIENTLYEFDIDADVIDVKVGPVVTQYAVSPIKEVMNPETGKIEINRVRVDRITSLQGDLAMALSAKTLRIEAPVPGHSYVGIEVPNRKPSIVGLRPILESETFFKKFKSPLCVPLGRDVSGEAVICDLGSLPHLLIGGTTGSGKSVFLTSLVMSLIMTNTPDQVKLIMLDPKRVELARFNGLPHLLGPVETESDRIVGVLRWTAREMDRRYKLMELENARNLDAYNAALGRRRKDEHLPYFVLIFDEIGDLMMSHPDETEGTITRLAQKARAAGIHLVIATQRPSVDVVTGLIKANFPGRISFAVASGMDSRVILDYIGAETLLGRGDMLYLAPDAAGPKRIQGCFVSDEELEEAVMYWRGWYEEQVAEGRIEPQRVAPWERGITRLEALTEEDPMLEEAIKIVCEAKEASTSMIQRRLGVGYPRAARLMDLMYELRVIGPPKSGGRSREVLVKNHKEALHLIKKR